MTIRFRFTIRDLLWLTALAAVCVGWWVDRRSVQRQSAIEFNKFRQEVVGHEKQVSVTAACWGAAVRATADESE